ncbi:MAG: ATP-binding protein [Verrucomicrobiota bacterium]
MKKWPLRWKIACYAAGLGIIATLAGASTTWLVMHFSEMAALDRRVAAEARQLFGVIHASHGDDALASKAIAGFATRDRMLALKRNEGKVVYLSAAISSDVLPRADGERTARLRGQSYRWSTFRDQGYTMQIGADVTDINHLGWDIVLGMLAAIPTVFLVVSLGGRWIARQALGPVETIREAAARISIHNLDQRLPGLSSGDEIAGLVEVLNRTLDRLQRSFEQGIRFSADASHHLRTPISVLRAGIEELLNDPSTPRKYRARVEALLHQTHQLTSVAENLLLLARADTGRLGLHPQRFNLREVLDGVCDDTRALAEPHKLTVETHVPAELPVLADRASTALITQNLVENAVKFNRPGGVIAIAAQRTDGKVRVIIGNNGRGIPAELGTGVFERFGRARPDGRIEGQGLGLSVARELARAQGGDVTLLASDETWTQFELCLPAADDLNNVGVIPGHDERSS